MRMETIAVTGMDTPRDRPSVLEQLQLSAGAAVPVGHTGDMLELEEDEELEPELGTEPDFSGMEADFEPEPDDCDGTGIGVVVLPGGCTVAE